MKRKRVQSDTSNAIHHCFLALQQSERRQKAVKQSTPVSTTRPIDAITTIDPLRQQWNDQAKETRTAPKHKHGVPVHPSERNGYDIRWCESVSTWAQWLQAQWLRVQWLRVQWCEYSDASTVMRVQWCEYSDASTVMRAQWWSDASTVMVVQW
jgi:hypothetical protein